jgi:AcrR family transcriptional regulator
VGPNASSSSNRLSLQHSNDPRAARTRARIADAVHELSLSGGEISVTSIARTAGISRASFYSHYASVDELANTLRRDAILFIGELYLVERNRTTAALIRSQERIVAHVAEHRALYRAVAALPASRDTHLLSVRAFARVIERAMSGHIAAPEGLDVPAVALYIASATNGMLDSWIAGELDLTEAELVDHLTRLLPPWFSDVR